jgi:NAD(P)H dehydrogenase (quinone)
MTTIGVTGSTGQLGRLVLEQLLDRGTGDQLVAFARDPGKLADLAARGVEVRAGDYSQPATWPAALAGIDVLLLVSGSEVGQRVAQHTAVIEAALAAGVGRVVYTSAPRADDTPLPLAPEHKATEEVLRASGLQWTILRNNWYFENYTRQLAQYLADGAIVTAIGDGPIGGASRADYAAAAVTVLTTDGHAGRIYELGGPAFTIDDLAATITDVTGTPVTHRRVTPAELSESLRAKGLDAGTAGFVASLDEAIARGDLASDPTDLVALIGRPTTPLADAVRDAYAKA